MQAAPPPAGAAPADSVAADSAAVDSVAVDSAVTPLDSVLVDPSEGVGALGRNVGQATEALAEGDVGVALDILLQAVLRFAIENLLPAVLVGLAFWVVYRVVQGLLRRALQRARRVDAGVQQLILRFTRFTVLAIATIAVLDELGIAIAPFIAGLGIAGIALGFAAQDTVQNLIAGVTILLDRPFAVGDNIELQDTFGTVEEITLRTTRVRTLNNEMAILPNATVISAKVINHSMLRALRVVVAFGIAYKEDPEEARRVALATTAGDGRLHPDYDPSVAVTGLGASSVDMALRLYLRDPQLEIPVRFEYTERVFQALRAADIEIPFPHLQLFIDEAKAFEGTPLLGPDGAAVRGAQNEPPREPPPVEPPGGADDEPSGRGGSGAS
ncbi:mechanosensitive ion channel family protein [Rubrivirga sp. S365]|uniref:Mechanosensitive ion channel family protein n=1 Tax=Rubrivirga litoralis TaxID=3075598 RepID=A0ABU3BT97_9BACT|nr:MULTISPECIES: mechanosensitive ion channel family protein [unclassified Rubrivirga]MDT0632518.1 mechanosensitive ion channel family protein [Rubrivirga sp. F394]MDT7856983.1 mechanosensitive ion channel family protein [Rubrivirga sp. S365]